MKKSHKPTKDFQSTQVGDMDIINQIRATFSDPDLPQLRSWGHLEERALFKNVREVLKPIPGKVHLTYQTPKGGGPVIVVRITNGYRINKEFLMALNAANIQACSYPLVFQAGKSTLSSAQ